MSADQLNNEFVNGKGTTSQYKGIDDEQRTHIFSWTKRRSVDTDD